MQETLITFIIPAYNAAPYLEACIDSIFAVDLNGHEREVIVINDGSTDGTAEVLRQCREKHSSVLVLTQENRGISVARNAGMDMARGKYICFVDADDMLDGAVNAGELVSLAAEGMIDIIGINLRQIADGMKARPYRRYVPIYNKVYAPAREFMRGRNLLPCSCAYIYRRAFIEEKHLRFMPSIYHEDEDFAVKVFLAGGSFIAKDVDWYLRILHKESVTTTTDMGKQRKKLRDVLGIIEELDRLSAADTEARECMECKMDYLVVDTLRLLFRTHYDKDFRKEIISGLKAMHRFPIRWRREPKYIAFNLLTRLRAVCL